MVEEKWQTGRQTERQTGRQKNRETTGHVNIDEVVVTTRAEMSVTVSDLQ